MKKLLATVAVVIGLVGCTTMQVKSLQGFQAQNIKKVCIIKNPEVSINGFESSLIRSFARHNIGAQLYPANSFPSFCEMTVNYEAVESWDFGKSLSYSKLILKRNGSTVSDVKYKLKGKGGFILKNPLSTDAKIDELVDVLIRVKNPAQ